MSATTVLLTAEQLLADPARYERGELVAGVFRPMTPASGVHGYLVSRLQARLLAHCEPRGLGIVFSQATGFLLRRAPDTVRCPDVSFVAAERLAPERLSSYGFIPLAPDLAVEVLSPSETSGDVSRKVDEYLGAGVRTVWVVDPATRMVTVHVPPASARRLDEHDTLDGADVVPGFTLPIASLYARLPRE